MMGTVALKEARNLSIGLIRDIKQKYARKVDKPILRNKVIP